MQARLNTTQAAAITGSAHATRATHAPADAGTPMAGRAESQAPLRSLSLEEMAQVAGGTTPDSDLPVTRW